MVIRSKRMDRKIFCSLVRLRKEIKGGEVFVADVTKVVCINNLIHGVLSFSKFRT